MNTPISLYVVDDHALFREGLLRLLEHDPRFRVVGSADSVEGTLNDIAGRHVDVLIVDYDLGGENAVTLVRELRSRGCRSRILLVTAGLPNHDALELVRLGVLGVVHKHMSPDYLRRSIIEVAGGKVFIEQRYLQSLMMSATHTSATHTLTAREREVMKLVLHGCTNREIGIELGTSEGSIKATLQQIFSKTGVRTRSQLVRIALEQRAVSV
jgi:two-component system nitrate/nitrite response regulator NarL